MIKKVLLGALSALSLLAPAARAQGYLVRFGDPTDISKEFRVTIANGLPVHIVASDVALGGGGPAGAVTATATSYATGFSSDLGTHAEGACSTDNGDCSLEASVKRGNQRLTSLIANLGTPFQAGGSIGNTAFGILTSANTIKFDPANNTVKPDGVLESPTAPASVTSAATVVTAPTAGFASGTFQITSIGTGNTVTFEQSNDNINFVSMNAYALPVGSTGAATATTAGMYVYSTSAGYVRARVSTYGSGTVTIAHNQKREADTKNGGSVTLNNAISIAGFQGVTPTPIATSLTTTVAAGGVSTLQAKIGQGNLLNMYLNNTDTVVHYLVAINTQTLPTTSTTLTVGTGVGQIQQCIPVPAGSIANFNPTDTAPEYYSNGIYLVNSTADCTGAAGAAAITLSTKGMIHATYK